LQHLVETAAVLLAGRDGARLLQILNVLMSHTSVLRCNQQPRPASWAWTASRYMPRSTAPC
jgi:hypothetical protein